jgi:aryl-alcohol dehydrogenase-like predicted oxidoreductase
MISKLILGTVQLGLDYGINNTQGKPTAKEAHRILDCAYDAGIRSLDTAAAYGTSHEVLGSWFAQGGKKDMQVYTKLAPNVDLQKNTVSQFLSELNIDILAGLSFHRLADYKSCHAHRRDELLAIVNSPSVKKLGVSMHSNEELEFCGSREEITLAQLPYNAFDNASLREKAIVSAQASGLEIQTRSAFLQGLFFKDEATIPAKLHSLVPAIQEIKSIANALDLTIGQLVLTYALQSKSNGVVFGVDSSKQLEEIITWSENTSQVTQAAIDQIDAIRISNISLLNPANWS